MIQVLGVEITNGWRITGGRSINGAKIIDFIDQKHPRRKKKNQPRTEGESSHFGDERTQNPNR